MDVDVLAAITGLGGLAVGLIVSPIAQFCLQSLAYRHERRQLLWERKVEAIREAEGLAGHVRDVLIKVPLRKRRDEVFFSHRQRLEILAGQLGRYDELHAALWQFLSAAAGVDAEPEDERVSTAKLVEPRKELEEAYRAFLDACAYEVARQQ